MSPPQEGFSFRALALMYFGAAFAVGAIGQRALGKRWSRSPSSPAAFCVVSGQIAAEALAAGLCPLREGDGIGGARALRIGRVGSIIGPLVGGELAAEKCSAATVFMVAALSAVWCGA